MHVVFLTHYYPPEIGAAQARIAALAAALAARGATVTVHTGVPHYPDGVIAPGYRLRMRQTEADGAVRVLRTWVYPAANRGVVRRLTGHATFAAGAALLARHAGPADVVVAESPPLFTAAGAVPYARRLRAPLVLNCSDLWPESAIAVGALRGRAPIAAAEWLERWCYAHAAAVTVPVAGMVPAAAARGARALQIPPAVDAARFASVPDLATQDTAGPLRVLYAGTLGMAMGLEHVVEAARQAGPQVVDLTLAGDGAEADALRARAASLPNVHVLGRVPGSRIPALYAEAQLGLVALRDRPVFSAALPTKMFEALAAGRGVLVSAPDGDATRLIQARGCGLAVAPEDPVALAGAFRALHEDPARVRALGAAGRSVGRDHDREHAVTRWSALLEDVVRGSRGDRPSGPVAAGRRRAG